MNNRIGRQFHIYPWLININGGAALKQPVWYGDVAMAIRKYCAAPETFDGKTMELAGPEVMAWSQLVEWFREVTETKRVPPRTPTAIARMYAGLLEFGPKPYISRGRLACDGQRAGSAHDVSHVQGSGSGSGGER